MGGIGLNSDLLGNTVDAFQSLQKPIEDIPREIKSMEADVAARAGGQDVPANNTEITRTIRDAGGKKHTLSLDSAALALDVAAISQKSQTGFAAVTKAFTEAEKMGTQVQQKIG